MKLILPIEVADQIESQLPPEDSTIRVDASATLDGDASDAEVYLHWYSHSPTVVEQILAAVPALRWLHTPSAGVDRILSLVQQRELIFTNGAGIHAIPIAEFVLAFMLNRAKRLSDFKTAQSEHRWEILDGIQELKEATLLILGAGGIGQEIAVRASAFGMRIWGSRRHPDDLPPFERVVGENEWRSLLKDADYVVIATPLTSDTQGMVDEAALRSMNRGAYLINIARGAIVDEAALLKALEEGWIAGAALDTFSTEPLPADSPFWDLPQVFVTPHCSGTSPQETERSLALFLDNLERYRTDKSLRNVVDRQQGY